MLDGLPKQRTIVPSCKRRERESHIVKPGAVREAMPVEANAEPAILTAESGRSTFVRRQQPKKSSWGISVTCDGVSNVTDDNVEHPQKTESPSVKTEEGMLKEVKP
jgi:hypothetical protein